METFGVCLPYPPSSNTMYGNRADGGGRRMSEKGRKFFADSLMILAGATPALLSRGAKLPMSGPFDLDLHFYPPDARDRDGDNPEKAVFDALVKCGWLVDDNTKIIPCHSTEHHAPVNGGCVIIDAYEYIETEKYRFPFPPRSAPTRLRCRGCGRIAGVDLLLWKPEDARELCPVCKEKGKP